MQLEINNAGVDVVVSPVLQPRNDNDGRQTGTPCAQVQMSELIAMDDTGAELTKVSTAEQRRVTTRPARHGGHHSVEHRRPRWGGLPGWVLLTLIPEGPDARPGRRSPPDAPASPRGNQPTPTQVGIERSSLLSRRTARMRAAYARASLCAPSEQSICVGRICVHSTGGAYALALLAIGALGESVSLPR